MSFYKGKEFVITQTGTDMKAIGSKANDTALEHTTVPMEETLTVTGLTTSYQHLTKKC